MPVKFSTSKILLLLSFLFICGISLAGQYDFLDSKEGIYSFSDYTTPKNRGVMILIEVTDIRPEAQKKGGILDDQCIDAWFKRPVNEMIRSIFIKEMQRNGMIPLIQPNSENADYHLTLEIISFYGGTQDREKGNAVKQWFVPKLAVGLCTFKVILKDRSGKVLTNVDYSTSSELEMARMTNYQKGAVKSLGMALREAVAQIQSEVDNRIPTRR
jgi:hypothetical protein